MNRLQKQTVALALPLILGLTAPAWAKHRSGSFIHRHPTLTTAAAGYGAYRMAKHGANKRQSMGRRGNFAERHPMLSGAVGAGIAHHYAKKHR